MFLGKMVENHQNWDKFHFEVYWLNLLYTPTISVTMIYCIHRLVCSAIIRSNKNAHIFVVLPFWTVALGIQMVLNLVRFSFPVNREHFDIFYVCGNEIDSTKKTTTTTMSQVLARNWKKKWFTKNVFVRSDISNLAPQK